MGRRKQPPPGIEAVTLRTAVDKFLRAAARTYGDGATVASKQTVMTVLMYRLDHHADASRLGEAREVWTITDVDLEMVADALVDGADDDENRWRRRNGMRARPGRTSASSINQAKATVGQFVKYCHRYRWLSRDVELHDEIFKSRKPHGRAQMAVPLQRIEPTQWPDFLDAADRRHARCRMAMALGLYTGRRVSEVVEMQWRHVNWDAEYPGLDTRGYIDIYNVKRGRWFRLPMFQEIRTELERWQQWAAANYGIPQPDWYLVPNRRRAQDMRGPNVRMALKRDPRAYPVDMTSRSRTETVWRDMRIVFAEFGIGPGEGTGTHTMRRSAATIIARRLGIRVAQTFLNHEHVTTTETYVQNEDGVALLHGQIAQLGSLFDVLSSGATVRSLDEARERRGVA